MGGGGSTDITTNNYDPLFNARMADLSEEQQEWAKELKNYYEFGVTYNPSETITGYYDKAGNFVEANEENIQTNPEWEARNQEIIANGYTPVNREDVKNPLTLAYASHTINEEPQFITIGEGDEIPEGEAVVTTTWGEINGYDTETPSYMKMELEQIKANTGLITSQADQAKAEAELGKEKATTEKGLLDDYQKQQEAGYSYDVAKYGADEALLPSYQRSTEAQYGASEAMANAEKALVNPWQNMMESQYGYQTGKYGVDTALLSPYYDATKAGYELSTGQSEAAMSLLPQETRLKSALMTEQETNTALRAPVAEKYYGEVINGIDVNKRVNEAKADVGESFKGAEQRTNMALSQYGINPNSGRARSAFSQTGMNYGRSVAGAATGARDKADNDNFARLSGAMALTPTTA